MLRNRPGLGLLMALAVGGGLLSAAGHAVAATPPSAAEFRRKVVAFAGGPGALDRVHTVAFDFVSVDSKTKARSVHHHAYDRDKGIWRYETSLANFAKTPFWNKAAGDRWRPDPNVPEGKELVAVFGHYPRPQGTVYIDGKPLSGAENQRLLARVNDSIDNDRYWLFLPLIIENPQVRLDPVAPLDDKQHGRLYGFSAYSGTNKAENRTIWTLYATAGGELIRTDVMILRNPAPVEVLWEKWQQFGPVRVALEHRIPKMNRRIQFEHVKVNEPVNVAPPGR